MNTGGGFTGAVVLIPTRNRSDLAKNAIQSVLSQAEPDLSVIVSDNSTSPDDVERLSSYCRDLHDGRLRYIRPPAPLTMSRHWDWALQQAQHMDCSHFVLLSDRMIFRPRSLAELFGLLRQHPDEILVYLHDRVQDFREPFTVDLHEWTGKLYDVRSTRLLELTATSVMYDCSCPRLLNCVTPRSVLEAISRRFGSICSSNAPDWNFAYRALDVVDTVLYYNAPLLVHYALRRSNGESAHRGIMNDAYADFVRELPVPVTANAPFPEIVTVWNAIISEYCTVRQEAQRVFPELDMARYAKALAWGIAAIEDPQLKAGMAQKLADRGWRSEPDADPPRRSSWRRLLSPRRVLQKLTTSRPVTFESGDEALKYAAAHPRPRSQAIPWEEALHRGTEVRR